jgi:kallikrein 15
MYALQDFVFKGDVTFDTTTRHDVFTKVCCYLEWIRETMKIN